MRYQSQPLSRQQRAGFPSSQNEPVSSSCVSRSIPSLVSRVLLGPEMAAGSAISFTTSSFILPRATGAATLTVGSVTT
eukprot:1574020-Pleurochrysis_carterae.AAC.3